MDYGKSKDVEERIQKAIAALSAEPDLTITAAARRFIVPPRHLRARLNGCPSRIDRDGPSKRLNKDQQKALKAYLKRCNELGMPALGPQLIHAAQSIIDRALPPGQEPTPLSKNWLPRYLKIPTHAAN